MIGFILILFAIGVIPAAIVWLATKGSTPGKAAFWRAACVAACFVPTLAPMSGMHGGAIPVPGWFMLIFGGFETSAGRVLFGLIFPPGVAFFVLLVWFRKMLGADNENPAAT